MTLRRRAPPPPLAQFVEAVMLFEMAAPSHSRERVLPDGCAQFVINLQADETRIYHRSETVRYERFNGALLIGPQSEYGVIDPAELVSVAGVHFKPGGAAAFFGPHIGELHGCHVPLDALWGNLARGLRERLLERKTPEERLDVLESALMAAALQVESRGKRAGHDGLVKYAVERFSRFPQVETIGQVVAKTGFSQRYFIELFRREVGMAPKRFCRIRRLQNALESFHSDRHAEWTAIAAEAGYFDQAHFIHDFQAFCGMSPTAYQAARPWHPNHIPLPE